MKSLLILAVACTSVLFSSAQDQPKKVVASPAAQAKYTLNNGTAITIDYSQPSLKGRTIGTDVEPKEGTVWRAGANKTTAIEFSKAVTINGKELPAGKYGFFVLSKGGEWTGIFTKTWDQWGTIYKESDDVLRVPLKTEKGGTPTEKLTYTIAKDGTVTLLWGEYKGSFTVK